MMSDLNFGLKIKQLIKKQNLTIEEAAETLGYTRQGFSTILKKEDINTAVLKKVCEVFNTDMSYFLTNNRYEVNQSGAFNVVGDAKNSYNKIGLNEMTAAIDKELIVLKTENLGLRNQIEGLKNLVESQRETIEILKNR
jgi:transcriptional regulator with XRE-family HTH domain